MTAPNFKSKAFWGMIRQKHPGADSVNCGSVQSIFVVWAKWTILDPKIAHPRNCGSIVTLFFKKFCLVKKAKR